VRGRVGCLGLGVSLGSLCESYDQAVRRGFSHCGSERSKGLSVYGGSWVTVGYRG